MTKKEDIRRIKRKLKDIHTEISSIENGIATIIDVQGGLSGKNIIMIHLEVRNIAKVIAKARKDMDYEIGPFFL